MLISAFSNVCGLPVETIRFYIKKGLLTPQRSELGGGNAYHQFSDIDVTTARMIRLQQSLGYSLREIAALQAEYRTGEHSVARTCEVLQTQINRLEDKRAQIDQALAFLRAKVDWVNQGKPDNAPAFSDPYC